MVVLARGKPLGLPYGKYACSTKPAKSKGKKKAKAQLDIVCKNCDSQEKENQTDTLRKEAKRAKDHGRQKGPNQNNKKQLL